MAVSFNQVPGNIRVPFVRFEVNAGTQAYQSIQRLLLIGQKTAAGSATAGTPILVTQAEDGLFGVGSMLALMYKVARKQAPLQEVWCVPLDDVAASTASFGTIEVSGTFPLTTATSLIIYVGGKRFAVPVNTIMSTQDAADSIVDYINDCDTVWATAAVTTTGVAATGTLTITGPATAAGTAALTIGDQVYSVAIANGDSAATIATKFVSAVDSAGNPNVSATAAAGVVTLTSTNLSALPNAFTTAFTTTATGVAGVVTALAGGVSPIVTVTAKNTGTLGNTLRIETKLYDDDGDSADTLLTITQPSGGAGDPEITSLLATLGEDPWHWTVMPWAQHAYLAEMEAWLDDRWGPMSQVYGHCITARAGTAGETVAFTSARNSWHVSCMPVCRPPQPIFYWAAAVGARCAEHLQDAPELSRPLQTIVLEGILPPKKVDDRWSTLQRQSFYYAGASGYRVQDGEVQLDRVTTMYQNNAWGSPDPSWLDINTIAQLQYGLPAMMYYLTQTYPRCALVDENPNGIQNFVTADDLRKGFIHIYKSLVADGVFENADKFAELLIVERDISDANRVNAYLPLDHVNQLRVLAVNATSYLQYDTII